MALPEYLQELETLLADAQAAFTAAKSAEALEAARVANDEGEILVLEAEYAEAREQLDALLAEWELLA